MKPKLYRSRQDKIVAGVCGGIAEHFNTDPIWIRLVAALLILADGVGFAVYLIAWIIIPENPKQKAKKPTAAEKAVNKLHTKERKSNGLLFGLLLIVIGVYFLLDNFMPWFTTKVAVPLVIIGIGLYLLLNKK